MRKFRIPIVRICSECKGPMPCACMRYLGWTPKAAKRWRSKAYLKFVRHLPCSVPGCKNIDIEAAHFGPKGIGTKVHDCLAIPLCKHHHRESHDYSREWEHYEDVMGWQIQTMTAAFIVGIE